MSAHRKRMPITVEPDMQTPLVDALKMFADEQHHRARKLASYVIPSDSPNGTQQAMLDYAAKQRRLADALHDLATQIQEG